MFDGYAWFSLDGKKLASTLILLALLSMMINLIGLAVPLALLQVYNRIIPNQGETTLNILVTGVLAALLVEAIFRWFRSYYVGWVGARFEHVTGCDIFQRVMHAHPKELAREGGANLLERMGSIQTVGELYSGQLLLALFDLPFLLLYLYLITQLGGHLALAPLAAMGVVVLVSYRGGIRMSKALDADSKSNMRRFGFITEALARIHSLKAIAMESQMLGRYELLMNSHAEKTKEIIFLSALLPAISAFIGHSTTVVVVALGSLAVMSGDLTTGGLAACTMLSGRLFQPLQTLVGGWTRLQNIRIASRDVDTLLKLPKPEERVEDEPLTAQEVEESLRHGFRFELEHVSVNLSGKKAVLDDISLTVNQGEIIGIVGDSGSGKTTLLQLLGGRVLPTGGILRFNGQTVETVPTAFINAVSYVPQKGTLFSGSILQNITMFDESRNEVGLRVATALGLDVMVSRMPKGYGTIVGDGAAESLPAGVVQRIAIARSLSMEPKVLLFDEANMAIDSAGDTLLRDTLVRLQAESNCTIVLVSWRPSLLRIAHRLLRLHNGSLLPLADLQEVFALTANTRTDPSAIPATMAPSISTPSMVGESDEAEEEPMLPWQKFLMQMPQTSLLRCQRVLLEALNWQGPARQLAEAMPHLVSTKHGGGELDITDFCNTMANLSYRHRSERKRLGQIDMRQTPFLFVGSGSVGEMVVMGRDKEGKIQVIHGIDGEKKGMSGNITGQAFYFLPPSGEPTRPGSWITDQMLRFSSLIWSTMAMTLLGNIFATSSALFNMNIYDSGIPSGSQSMVMGLLAGTLLAISMDALLRAQRARTLAYVGAKAERILGASIFGRLLAMPAPMTERVAVGVQVARIRSLEVVRDLFTGHLAMLYYDAPTTLFFLLVLGIISPGVIILMLLLIACLVGVGAVLVPLLRKYTSTAGRLQSQRQAFLTESFTNIPVIQSGHGAEIWYDRYRELSGKAILANFYVSQITSVLSAAAHVLTMAASVGVMAMTAKGVLAGTQTAGSVVAAMMLTWRILAPIQTTFLGITKMVQIFTSLNQVDRLMEIKGERDSYTTSRGELQLTGAVLFSRVSFRYSNDAEPALVGVNFKVPPGSVVAVIGANGSGKSTLIKLLLGLYTPQAGSIQIDGEDIRQLDPIMLRQSISYLPQICDIFYGTLAQNLRLANPVATDGELEQAAFKAGLLADIHKMPEGFNTRVDESRTSQLPIGFKQRLSLARVYLKRSRIVLFDEPANNLDAESEEIFREAVKEMRGNTTIFLVTHRPSHMQMADLVLYLDAGYLRGAAPPEEIKKLLSKNFV
ncbi:MAG: ATP-binding cassette domain-containing protein [Magnetococcales bacterium]|nr:ATP-binding cassette domain-containing protein [Magnetococcales bacterium]